jgi:N6-adenosine-specific RNA methylase IME4
MKNSRQPDELYEISERGSAGCRLELFARDPRADRRPRGNEVPATAIHPGGGPS